MTPETFDNAVATATDMLKGNHTAQAVYRMAYQAAEGLPHDERGTFADVVIHTAQTSLQGIIKPTIVSYDDTADDDSDAELN